MSGVKHKHFILVSFLLLFYTRASLQTVPEGFTFESFLEDLTAPADIEFAQNGLMYLSEFNGLVWVIENGVKDENPIIDISEEVAYYGDLGLSGFALHPDFLSNGYVYLLYAVDQYYLLNHDSPDYDPNISYQYTAQIGRLTRYQLSTADYRTLIPNSRTVLIGDQIDNGFAIVSPTHGTGDLVFGVDNSLLISSGDGTTWVDHHTGGDPRPEFGYDSLGIALNIISAEDDVGSMRSQYFNSYNGKILRIDPLTGSGYESNPFFDENEPNGIESKIWAMGLRNPYRMCMKPNSGTPDPNFGNPGTLYIGDVGLTQWEELNICNSAGLNFGWPVFEGQIKQPGYIPKPTYNPLYSNPLFNGSTCNITNYRFRDLIEQPNANHANFFENPCDAWVEIEDAPTFVHERPIIAWLNFANQDNHLTYVPGFDAEGNATPVPLEESNVEGEEFDGIASAGGVFYNGISFPEEYFGAYFHIDFSGWIKTFWFDENDQLLKVSPFLSNLDGISHISFNPFDECLYVIQVYSQKIFRICYGKNLRPVAIIQADTLYGPSPLTVQFDGSGSFDPDNDPITYDWDFGDDNSSNEIAPEHTFVSSGSEPQAFEVTLTVTDTASNEGVQSVIISLNNTPPQVNITGFEDGFLYPLSVPTLLNLEADVMDLEHADSELTYEWQVFFHHNTHFHPEPVITDHLSSFLIDPIDCSDLDSYYYRVRLKVTDAAGLSDMDEHSTFPDCSDTIPEVPIDGYVLFPNPSDHYIQVKGEFTENPVMVSIYNLMGQEVFKDMIEPLGGTNLPVEIFGLRAGGYVLKMEYGEVSKSFVFIKY